MHGHLGDCVASLRVKMAAITNDPDWLPAPEVKRLSFAALRAKAMATQRARAKAEKVYPRRMAPIT